MTSAVSDDTTDQDVFGGVDSHADTIHVAVISDNGGHLADAELATTTAGYAAALAFLNSHGQVREAGGGARGIRARLVRRHTHRRG